MSLTKVNYIDNSTIITAKNLNDIQDNIIELNKLEDKIIYGKGKNLLKNTAKNRTYNGLTLTVNDDGSVTLNGTATNTTIFVIGYISVKAGTDYICTSGNDLLRYSFRLEDGNTVVHDFSANNIYTPDSDNRYTVCIRVGNGATVNETSYPMIRLASETDDTYEPYYEGLKEVHNKLSMELLWENASPNSGFVSQTLNLDFSDAEFAFVEPNVGYGVFVRKGKICGASAFNVWAVGENAGNCHFRQITLYDSNIAFDRGVVLSFTAGSAIESNDAWIPVRIYKVKGVSA